MNTEELKYSLFTAVKTEADKYLEVSRTSNNTAECEIARQRYNVLYEQIECCGLEEEYDNWERWEWGCEED